MKLILYAPFILAASLGAQVKSDIKPSTPNKPPFNTGPGAPQAALTELEATKLELYGTQNVLLRQQEQELKTKFDRLIRQINIDHPGYIFNQQTGTLVAIPAQPPLPKVEEVKPPAPPEVKK